MAPTLYLSPVSSASLDHLICRIHAFKRLLYVACTRAADLLVLPGRSSGRNTWLALFLDI